MKKKKIINEVVYADSKKINNKKKTIGLTYTKGNRASNNANTFDKLGTYEMDQENANTIEVPLKGGLISYNITDIKGTEVMHYFKKKWAQRQQVSINVNQGNNEKESYELEMDNNNEREFINQFIHKVENVIKAWILKNKKDKIPFSGISILPVDSTSNFNQKFVKEELSRINIYNLLCQVVDPNMIVKDTRKMQRDEEFIKNNQEFYNSSFALNKPEMGTINQRVNNVINKNNALNIINDKIKQINEIVPKLLNFLNNNKNLTELSPLKIKNLKNYYTLYVDLIRECYSITYTGAIDNKQHSLNHEDILNAIKYSKGPSIDNRSSILWNLVKPYVRGEVSNVDGKRYGYLPLCLWKKADFEIKPLRNAERLGIKNIYNVNSEWDEKRIMEELNKIKGTILLIFDDNISGGATLSDVCLQCKNLGIENIIPITFGKMSESNTMGNLMLNTPEQGYNFLTNNELSLYNGPKKEKRKNSTRTETLNHGKELFYKNHDISNKKTINILWLDDIREPYTYFSKPRLQSGAWKRNHEYYENNIFNQYNPNFIWVKSLKEFSNYILNNGLPDMISFDHDIKPKNYYGKFETGADVAKWLVNFCNSNNIKLPWTFIHSANENGRTNIGTVLNSNVNENTIKINEKHLKEIISDVLKKIFL